MGVGVAGIQCMCQLECSLYDIDPGRILFSIFFQCFYSAVLLKQGNAVILL